MLYWWNSLLGMLLLSEYARNIHYQVQGITMWFIITRIHSGAMNIIIKH